MPTLVKKSPSSYRCAVPQSFGAWLVEQGYRTEDPRSEHEYLRLHKGASLIVVYRSGSVILQGGDLETPRELFKELILEPGQLPF